MDYRSLHIKTVADLRLLAKENGVRVPAGTNKEALIQLILEKSAQPAVEAPAQPAEKKRRGRPPKFREELKPEMQEEPVVIQEEISEEAGAEPAPAL